MKKFVKPIVILMTLLFTSFVFADEQQDKIKEKMIQSYKAALLAATSGPSNISLLDQASLNLPKNYLFVPAKEGDDLLQAFGNSSDDRLVGLVLPEDYKGDTPWIITIDYNKEGFIKDDEAKKWNADDLLKSIKESNEESNKERKENGFATLEVIGWIEKPFYDEKKHQLIWSIRGKSSDTTTTDNNVNYNTYKLGRDGYFSFDLLTSESDVEKDKLSANEILNEVTYNKGKQYGDFNASTDKIAAFGIAALITGVAAKKLGLLAMSGVLLVKLWKAIIVIPVLFWSRIKRFFKRASS